MNSTFEKLEIEIHAPKMMIWNIVSDINNYGQWNSIVPYARGNLIEGERLIISLKFEQQAQKGSCLVNIVSPFQYFVLSRKLFFKWFLYMEHSFIIQRTTTSTDSHKFIQTLAVSGILSRPMTKTLKRKWVKFYRMNLDLRNYIIKKQHGISTRLEEN